MEAQTAVPFVDTNIIPDRNAGIGSLLWDLQNPQDPDLDGPPLLDPEFAFIDVGVSRAKVSTALKMLLASDLKMDVDYVATERLEAVPYANVTLLGDRAEKIRACLSGMISSKDARREVKDWHCVVDRQGKVSSVAYSYDLLGNEVWESYFMGRTFMYSGELVEFSDPKLDEMLAPDVLKIEAGIEADRKRDRDPSQPGPAWDGYRMEGNPLEAGLAQSGIALQETDVPQRIKDRQNVLFLGNILNHYPQDAQARELDRIAASMEEGDIVIVQVDEVDRSSIEVFHVRGQGAQKTRERVRRINTEKLEIQKPVRGPGPWRQIRVKPRVDRMVSHLIDRLGMKVSSPEWRQEGHKALVHQHISHVFRTFFRALPVEETLRIAIREALRRVPSEGGPKGIPVFKDDAKDAYGGALGLDPSPIVSEADFIHLGLTNPGAEKPRRRFCAPADEPAAAQTAGGANAQGEAVSLPEAIMIQAMIKLRLPASRMKEAVAMLRPLVESTKTVPGCVDCALHRDVLEDDVVLFYDRWNDERGLQRHLRSEEYRDLLLVMEMAKEAPEVRFDVISHTSGLEAIERARTDVADLY